MSDKSDDLRLWNEAPDLADGYLDEHGELSEPTWIRIMGSTVNAQVLYVKVFLRSGEYSDDPRERQYALEACFDGRLERKIVDGTSVAPLFHEMTRYLESSVN
jgi:hypothetical protein